MTPSYRIFSLTLRSVVSLRDCRVIFDTETKCLGSSFCRQVFIVLEVTLRNSHRYSRHVNHSSGFLQRLYQNTKTSRTDNHPMESSSPPSTLEIDPIPLLGPGSSASSIFATLEDAFDAFHPLESGPFTPFNTSPSILATLPREIRDMIYANLIEAGHLGLLRTSKAVCREATELLYKQGTCRLVLNFGVDNGPKKGFALKAPMAAAIQSLDVHIMVVDDSCRDLHLFNFFRGPSVRRNRCRITLQVGGYHPHGRSRKVVGAPLDLITTLIGFRTLTVDIRTLCPLLRTELLQTAKEHLRLTLGQGIWHGRTEVGGEDQYLEFYPREYWETHWEKYWERKAAALASRKSGASAVATDAIE